MRQGALGNTLRYIEWEIERARTNNADNVAMSYRLLPVRDNAWQRYIQCSTEEKRAGEVPFEPLNLYSEIPFDTLGTISLRGWYDTQLRKHGPAWKYATVDSDSAAEARKGWRKLLAGFQHYVERANASNGRIAPLRDPLKNSLENARKEMQSALEP